MTRNTERLQTFIGILGFSFVSIVGLVNFVGQFLIKGDAVKAVLYPGVLVMIPCGIILLVTALWQNKWTKIAQVLLLLACAPIPIMSDFQGMVGMSFIGMSIVLLHRYDMLVPHALWKLVPIAGWTFFWMVKSISQSSGASDSPFVWGIKVLVLMGMLALFVYIAFEEEIKLLRKDNQLIEMELDRKRTLARIGETTAGVVHSLKNNLNLFNVGLFYIESGTNVAKGTETINRGVRTMHDRLQSLLEMSRIDEKGEPELINLSMFVSGTFNLLYADTYSRAAISFRNNEQRTIPIVLRKVPLVMILENLFQNALEEFQKFKDPKMDKFVEMEIIPSGFIIRNNAGDFPLCEGCKFTSCLECPRFSKIGWTTKKEGSGNGISFIIRTCRDFGWNFRIRNVGNNVVEFVFTW